MGGTTATAGVGAAQGTDGGIAGDIPAEGRPAAMAILGEMRPSALTGHQHMYVAVSCCETHRSRRGGAVANDGEGGPQQPAREPREGAGKQGYSGSMEEATAREGGRGGAAAGEIDTTFGWQWGRSITGEGRGEGQGGEETLAARRGSAGVYICGQT